MQAKGPQESVDEIILKFVNTASQLTQVQIIVLQHERGDIPRIWTVIDAPPAEHRYLYPVIHAQIDAVRDHDGPVIDFHVINMQEMSEEPADYLPDGEVVFERKRAA